MRANIIVAICALLVGILIGRNNWDDSSIHQDANPTSRENSASKETSESTKTGLQGQPQVANEPNSSPDGLEGGADPRREGIALGE